MLAVVEWDLLLDVVWSALLGGVGATAMFAVVIYAGSRSAEARRTGDGTAATAFGLVAATAFLVVCGAVVLAIAFILDKG